MILPHIILSLLLRFMASLRSAMFSLFFAVLSVQIAHFREDFLCNRKSLFRIPFRFLWLRLCRAVIFAFSASLRLIFFRCGPAALRLYV